MSKLCVNCEERPRKISKSGKELTMCNECQKAYWRSKKPSVAKPKRVKHTRHTNKKLIMDKPATRRCKTCKTSKPIKDFGRWGVGYRSTCIACNEAKTEAVQHDGDHILLVNGNQVVLAQVISEQASTKNPSLLVGFYEAQGYSIQHVFEKEV